MRALRVICLAAAFHSITAVPGGVVPFDDGNYQNDRNADGRNVEREAQRRRPLESWRNPTSTTVVSYNGGNVHANPTMGTHSSPSRHAKHRRRQRCRNRLSCLTPTPTVTTTTTTTSSSKQRNYNGTNESYDEYSSPVTESAGGILILGEHAIASAPSPGKNADAKRLIVANVTVNDHPRAERNDRRVPAQNDEDDTTGLIDVRTSTPYEYTEDEGVTPDAESETLTKGNEESTLLSSPEPEEADMYDENDFETVYIPPWSDVKPSMEKSRMAAITASTGDDYAEAVYEALLSSIFVTLDSDFPFRDGLTRLFPTIGNVSVEDSRELLKELNLIANMDPCQKWLNSWDKFERAFFGSLLGLPACPCRYPSDIFYDDKIWDEKRQKYYRWRDVSSNSQHLDVYKPGAAYCVRSLPAQGSGSAAAQHCCYDNNRRLLTRGSGAGTPNFVSPEISVVLHERIDVLPWRLCKGDFSRFNKVRPPNNDNNCDTNPDDEEYQRQIEDTKYY